MQKLSEAQKAEKRRFLCSLNTCIHQDVGTDDTFLHKILNGTRKREKK